MVSFWMVVGIGLSAWFGLWATRVARKAESARSDDAIAKALREQYEYLRQCAVTNAADTRTSEQINAAWVLRMRDLFKTMNIPAYDANSKAPLQYTAELAHDGSIACYYVVYVIDGKIVRKTASIGNTVDDAAGTIAWTLINYPGPPPDDIINAIAAYRKESSP